MSNNCPTLASVQFKCRQKRVNNNHNKSTETAFYFVAASTPNFNVFVNWLNTTLPQHKIKVKQKRACMYLRTCRRCRWLRQFYIVHKQFPSVLWYNFFTLDILFLLYFIFRMNKFVGWLVFCVRILIKADSKTAKMQRGRSFYFIGRFFLTRFQHLFASEIWLMTTIAVVSTSIATSKRWAAGAF